MVRCFHSHEKSPQVFLTQPHVDVMTFFDALTLEVGLNPPTQVLQKHLEPLRSLSHDTMEQKLCRLGYAWVAVGTALLELLIPDTPVDPVAIQNTTILLRQNERDRISSEIRLHQSLERIMTGNEDSFTLSVLRRRLRNIVDNMGDGTSVVGRDNVAQLHAYWAEVRQFKNQVISESKIFNLLQSFTTPSENTILREQVTQESITGFHQRLSSVYPEFSDLNMLLKLAMSQLRLGIRLVSKANTINAGAARTVSELVRYPSTREYLEAPPNHQSSVLPAFDSIYLDLVRFAFQASMEAKSKSLLQRLEQSYGQVLGLWLIDKAKEAENEAAAQSLYRRSTAEHSAMTDAELEQREFLALFPSFENSLVGETGTLNQTARSDKNLPDDNMVQIANLHLSLFSSSNTIQEGLTRINGTQKKLLLEIMGSHVHSTPESLDAIALAHRLRLAYDAQTNLQTPVGHYTSYNFYQDPNLPELKGAMQVINTLRVHLKRLFDEWPEQMVLQHLIDRCDVILGFSLKSPVAKVLSALEQLLLQTDDWEMYANRDNSLSSHRQSLTELIVRWRRLELSCWNGLLESEARTFAEGGSEWWFRLHNAIIRGLSDTMKSGEEDTYLAKLIPLIDEFVSSSPLGQLSFRIRLLQSFERYISDLSTIKSGSEKRSLHRVIRIIHSTLQYYQLHQPSLQSHLAEQRTVLDKEIKNFIKLASWKDVNVQALKQSAQKTHHQLYKIIRKFREVLREPIYPRLKIRSSTVAEAQTLSQTPREQTGGHQSSLPAGLIASATGPLSDLGTTFKKFETVHSSITSFIRRRVDNHADDLAIAIIATSKELSDVPVPTNLSSEKRTKFLKSLLVRKRKALSDLLKELKNIGLAGHVKAQVLQQNNDNLWLREQPILSSAIANLEVERVETYFSRLLGCLPELRSSLSDHHGDLQTRELLRGLSFLESGFSMAIDLRAR